MKTSQPPNSLRLLTLQYELALLVGRALVLEDMLRAFFPTALKLLGCRSAYVWLHKEEVQSAVLRYAFPRAEQFRVAPDGDLAAFSARLVTGVHRMPATNDGGVSYAHSIHLGQLGHCILVREGMRLDEEQMVALVPVFERLALACSACLEHEQVSRLREMALSNERQLRAVVDTMKDGVIVEGSDGRLALANRAVERLAGGDSQFALAHSATMEQVWAELPSALRLSAGDAFQSASAETHTPVLNQEFSLNGRFYEGSRIPVVAEPNGRTDGTYLGCLWHYHDISERRWRQRELEVEAHEQKKAETLQRVLYRITERAAAGLVFHDFLSSVHSLLNELLYAKNCYVCQYDSKNSLLSFPYYVDERDGDSLQVDYVPYRRGLTEFVLRTGCPQIIDARRLLVLEAAGEVTEGSGDMSFTSWLGVPMHIGGAIAGMLAVQAYEPGIGYTEADADVLSYVANHVSSAIERYQALDELRKSEERYRTVIEKVGVGVVVVQDGQMVFANPSLVRIVGHPLDYLLSQPFTATILPDDVEAVRNRHERRLLGEPVEPVYGFRIVTAEGEIRSLELSAVKIEWGQRDATLMFVVDATARIAAERVQRETVQQQMELNSMRARFISMASHEFRTPLATILSSQDLLLHYNDRLPEDDRKSILSSIATGVHRMTDMLDRVLLINKAEAHMLEFKPTVMDLRSLCESLILETANQIGETRCRVLLDYQRKDGLGLYDEKLLRHILGNLLSNAVKYSPEGGDVILKVNDADEKTNFEVSDRGIGIPEAEIATLFEPFRRASNVGAISGSGLGLSIVKQAVELHEGRIEVRSHSAKGTTFIVSLPLRSTAPIA